MKKEQGREDSTQDKQPGHGNQPNDLEVQEVIGEELNGCTAMNLLIKSDLLYFKSQTGNCDLNLSQLTGTLSSVDCHENETPNLKSLLAHSSSHAPAQVQNAIGCALEGLVGVTKTLTKRSKRRENSMDEQISDRAERLKAKRNLDAPGTPHSKPVLSFSDSCINSRIDKLGVSFGSDVKQCIRNIKRLEADRLEQDADQTHKQRSPCIDSENDISEDDSDSGIDQQAIQHIIGDIANDILDDIGSHLTDFKPRSKKNKAGSRKKKKSKKLVYHNKH
jgi:hypothetical protein